jgi:hypothetical protein
MLVLVVALLAALPEGVVADDVDAAAQLADVDGGGFGAGSSARAGAAQAPSSSTQAVVRSKFSMRCLLILS